eukprot:432408-Alexandrium_andersonii.AAC.1
MSKQPAQNVAKNHATHAEHPCSLCAGRGECHREVTTGAFGCNNQDTLVPYPGGDAAQLVDPLV